MINPTSFLPLTKRLRPPTTDPLAHYGSVGVGSLQSYYETGVETETPSKKAKALPHPNKGPAPLFGWIDVMGGAASAPNHCIWEGTGLDTNIHLAKIDNASIDFQLILGKYRGFRLSKDPEYKEEPITKYKDMNPTYDYSLDNNNIYRHEAQNRHGMHYIDPTINREAGEFAQQTKVGDGLTNAGRHRGFERELNPANNGGKGEDAYHNPLTLDKDVPTVIPMEPDTIRINDELIRPEDTTVALEGNIAPGMDDSS